MNRVTKVYQTKDGGQRVLMEQHTYDTYPSGVTGANPKELRTASHLAEVGPDGGVTGFADVRFVYDDRKRPVQTQIRYRDGSILSEQTEYGFAGEVISSLYTYSSGGNVIGKLQQNYTYDNRGRICSETATLYKSVGQNVSALKRYVYDDLGRVSGTVTEVPGGIRLVTDMEHTLQGWVSSQETSIDGEILFAQNLGYDSGNILSGTEPSYTGLITRKDDTWFQNSQQMSILTNGYTYDYAGRLASEVSDDLSTTEYGYDARGNLLSVLKTGFSTSSIYSGDVLTSVTSAINGAAQTVSFVHDALGLMTYDGTTGQAMTYNTLDLIGKVSKGGTVLANYFYLADGTKIGALDGSGEGLMYRGPFVYRKTSGSSSLTLESAAFGGGRLTPDGALLYVTDYLGSVRAVVNGSNGAIYKASDYSPYGEQSDAESMQTASTPAWITLRDAYTGQEDQHPDFGTGYTDFGSRQYSPALRRWMAPDPLSEKYYGISPYAFCANNPVNIVDADGESWGKVVKVANKIRKAKKAGDKVRLKGILKSEVLDIADNASTLADSDASLFEKSVAVIDLATGFGDQVKWFAKTCGISNAVIDGVQVIDGIKFKSFTRNNFRDNLGRLTGGIPDGMQAHHTLPYKFEKKFSDIGINIHDPKYGVWLDNTLHNKLSQEYNKAWEKFFIDNPSYTAEQVMEYATKLMNDIFGQ